MTKTLTSTTSANCAERALLQAKCIESTNNYLLPEQQDFMFGYGKER